MTDKERLESIKKEWKWFFGRNLYNSNMQHLMSGSIRTCFDFIWLIQTLEKKLKEEK